MVPFFLYLAKSEELLYTEADRLRAVEKALYEKKRQLAEKERQLDERDRSTMQKGEAKKQMKTSCPGNLAKLTLLKKSLSTKGEKHALKKSRQASTKPIPIKLRFACTKKIQKKESTATAVKANPKKMKKKMARTSWQFYLAENWSRFAATAAPELIDMEPTDSQSKRISFAKINSIASGEWKKLSDKSRWEKMAAEDAEQLKKSEAQPEMSEIGLEN